MLTGRVTFKSRKLDATRKHTISYYRVIVAGPQAREEKREERRAENLDFKSFPELALKFGASWLSKSSLPCWAVRYGNHANALRRQVTLRACCLTAFCLVKLLTALGASRALCTSHWWSVQAYNAAGGSSTTCRTAPHHQIPLARSVEIEVMQFAA
jgi:hypothetical protein